MNKIRLHAQGHALQAIRSEVRAGVIGAGLLAVNPFLIRHAQEVRGYTPVVCLKTLADYIFVPAIERRTLTLWVAWAACTVSGVYTHFFAGLVCLAQPGTPGESQLSKRVVREGLWPLDRLRMRRMKGRR